MDSRPHVLNGVEIPHESSVAQLVEWIESGDSRKWAAIAARRAAGGR
jgi:hypothetical protein